MAVGYSASRNTSNKGKEFAPCGETPVGPGIARGETGYARMWCKSARTERSRRRRPRQRGVGRCETPGPGVEVPSRAARRVSGRRAPHGALPGKMDRPGRSSPLTERKRGPSSGSTRAVPRRDACAVPGQDSRDRALFSALHTREGRMTMAFMSVEEQMKILMRGVVDLVSEEELRQKLERSREDGQAPPGQAGHRPHGQGPTLGYNVPLRKLRDFVGVRPPGRADHRRLHGDGGRPHRAQRGPAAAHPPARPPPTPGATRSRPPGAGRQQAGDPRATANGWRR